MAETNSSLNCRTGDRIPGSNPGLSAKPIAIDYRTIQIRKAGLTGFAFLGKWDFFFPSR